MEITSLVGFVLGLAVVGYGVWETGIAGSVLNLHGLVIVVGGTAASVIFHCNFQQMATAIKGLGRIFSRNPYRDPQVLISVISSMAGLAKQNGVVPALQGAPKGAVNGFMDEAVGFVVDNINNQDMARVLLDRRINASKLIADESVNVYRVASVLSPMFGLIGTLLGIIQVLKNISDPTAVGAAMAIAISSALFGIALANIVFVPVAGKLRAFNQDEHLARILVADGLMQILKGEIPLVIEQRLWALFQSKKA